MADSADQDFGKIAVELKLITPEQLDEALGIFKDYESQGMRVRLREILRDMETLTEEQIKQVASRQNLVHIRDGDKIFCKLAVKRKMITQAQVDEYMKKQEANWKETGAVERVGEMMMNDGVIDPLKFTDLLVEVTGLQEKGGEAAVEGAAETAPREEFNRFKTCPTCGNPMPLSARACKVCQDRAAGIPDIPPPEPVRAPVSDEPPAGPPTARDLVLPELKEYREKEKAKAAAKGKDSRVIKAAAGKPEVVTRPLEPAPKKGGLPMGAVIVGLVVVVAGAGVAISMFLPKPDGSGTKTANVPANVTPANTVPVHPVNAVSDNPEEMLAQAEAECAVDKRKALFEAVLAKKPGEPAALLGRAACLIHLGADDDARKELEALLKADAKNGAAALWRACLGLRSAAPRAEIDADLDLAAKSADKAVAGAGAGYQLLLKKDWVRAHGEFNTVLKARNDFYPALVGRSRAFHGMGKYKEASSDIEGATHAAEGSADAYFWRGWERLADGKGQAALDDFSHAGQIGLDAPHARYLRAIAALECGTYATAASGFDRLVQKDGKNADYLLGRARAYAGQGDTALALADLEAILSLDPARLDAAVERARVLLRRNDVAKAREAADALLKSAPESWETLLAHAEIVAAQGELDAARADVKKVWDKYGDVETALVGLVRAHYALGEEKEADRAADKLSKSFPRNVPSLTLRALWLADHGRAKDARLAAQKLLEIAPDDALGLTCGALADLIEGNKQPGMDALQRATDLCPGLAEPLLARCRALVAQQQTGTAVNLLAGVFKDYEKRPFGHNTRGLIFLMEGKNDDAKRAFDVALEHEPRYAPGINNQGVLAFAAGKFEDAQKLFERAIAVDPLLAAAHLNRAFAMVARMTDVRGSIRAYRRAVEINPLYAEGVMGSSTESGALRPALNYLFDALTVTPPKGPAHTLGGYVRLADGKVREALDCFRTASAADSQNAWALNGMGLAEQADGMVDDAANAFTHAIDLDRNVAEFYANRGYVLAKQNKKEDALADQNKAIELDDKMAQAYAYRGKLYLENSEYAKAVKDLARAIELDPDNVLALAARGRAYMESGDFAKALVDLDAALRVIDPGRFPPAEHKRARLDRFTLLAFAGIGHRVAQEWPLLFLVTEDKVSEDAPDADAIERFKKELSNGISESESSRSDPKSRAALYERRAIVNLMKNDFANALSDLGRATECDDKGIEYRFTRGCSYMLQGELDSAVLEWGYLQRKALQNPGEPGGFAATANSPYVKLGVEAGEAALYDWLVKLSKHPQGLAAAGSFEEPKELEARMKAAGAKYAQRVRDDRVREDAQAMFTNAQKIAATNKERGKDLYQDIIKRFPNTTFAKEAQEKIKELDR